MVILMVNVTTSIIVPAELLAAAKEANLNISRICRDALKNSLSINDLERIEKMRDELKRNIDSANNVLKEIDRRIEEYKESEKNRQKEIEEMFSTIPELQNLTKEQISDVRFLMKLVDLVREKYNKKIGISDITNYYKAITWQK